MPPLCCLSVIANDDSSEDASDARGAHDAVAPNAMPLLGALGCANTSTLERQCSELEHGTGTSEAASEVPVSGSQAPGVPVANTVAIGASICSMLERRSELTHSRS